MAGAPGWTTPILVRQAQREAVRGLVGDGLGQRIEAGAQVDDGRIDLGGRGGAGDGCAPAVRPLANGARKGSLVSWLIDAGEVRQRLALVDGAGRVLDQVRQRGAEVVEPVGEVGVAELPRGDGGVGDRRRAGDDDVHRDRTVWVSGEADGPKVAVIVASSVLLSGVEASGVSVIVSVVDWPTPARRSGARPVSVSPMAAWRSREMLSSGTLPTFVIVIVSVTRRRGWCSRPSGWLVTVTASIAGTVNVSVCVWVIDESVVLVAVTVNESWVPGAGIGWPVFGCR